MPPLQTVCAYCTSFRLTTKPDKINMVLTLSSVVADEFGDCRELSEWVSKLDTTLQIQIFSALESIKKNPSSKSDYAAAYQALKASDRLTVSSEKHVSDRWKKSGFNAFKFDGSADPGTLNQVQGWATKVVTGVEPTVSCKVVPASSFPPFSHSFQTSFFNVLLLDLQQFFLVSKARP